MDFARLSHASLIAKCAWYAVLRVGAVCVTQGSRHSTAFSLAPAEQHQHDNMMENQEENQYFNVWVRCCLENVHIARLQVRVLAHSCTMHMLCSSDACLYCTVAAAQF